MKIQESGIVLAMALTAACAAAQSAPATVQSLTDDDRTAIQVVVSQYAEALGGCRASEFADLFAPGTGAFASTVRGRMVGREKLILLVESERQCGAPPAGNGPAKGGQAKTGARPAPAVQLEVTASGVRGIANLGTAEYQDEYVKTPRGWLFASRTVLTSAEKAAGLDAAGLLAIQRLGGANLGDHYEPDQNGVERLITSGVRVNVSGDQVTGKAYFNDGSYDDQIYDKASLGEWRVKSSAHVPPAAH